MPADEILLDSEERMEKAVDVFKHSMAGIRTVGRTPAWSIRSAWKSTVPQPRSNRSLRSAPEPTQIVIRPFDPGTIKDIEKAIRSSDLGLNPQNDGRVIRINIPALSTDVRRKLVSRIKELGEEAKVAIRNVRRDANKAADQEQKDKILTEDDRDSVKDEIQELTKKFEAKVENLARAKESEVMDG